MIRITLDHRYVEPHEEVLILYSGDFDEIKGFHKDLQDRKANVVLVPMHELTDIHPSRYNTIIAVSENSLEKILPKIYVGLKSGGICVVYTGATSNLYYLFGTNGFHLTRSNTHDKVTEVICYKPFDVEDITKSTFCEVDFYKNYFKTSQQVLILYSGDLDEIKGYQKDLEDRKFNVVSVPMNELTDIHPSRYNSIIVVSENSLEKFLPKIYAGLKDGGQCVVYTGATSNLNYLFTSNGFNTIRSKLHGKVTKVTSYKFISKSTFYEVKLHEEVLILYSGDLDAIKEFQKDLQNPKGNVVSVPINDLTDIHRSRYDRIIVVSENSLEKILAKIHAGLKSGGMCVVYTSATTSNLGYLFSTNGFYRIGLIMHKKVTGENVYKWTYGKADIKDNLKIPIAEARQEVTNGSCATITGTGWMRTLPTM